MQTGLTNAHQTPVSMPADNAVKKQYMITRRLFVQITASLDELQKSVGSDRWCPLNGRIAKVFGVSGIFQGEQDDNASAQMLQNAILHKVTIFGAKK